MRKGWASPPKTSTSTEADKGATPRSSDFLRLKSYSDLFGKQGAGQGDSEMTWIW
jgi:hypothetical protein